MYLNASNDLKMPIASKRSIAVSIMIAFVVCCQYTEAKLTYNFHNKTHHSIHVCSSDFREFSRHILFESVLMRTTRNVCKQYGIREWNFMGNITEMPQRMKDIYNLPGNIMSECASLSFQARVSVPGMLKNIVPHALLDVAVDVCVRGAHAYHTVYLENCPLFGTIVFSHDISAWTSRSNENSNRKAIVTTDSFVQVPYVLNSLGNRITADISLQSLQDVDILIESMCFNMSSRHVSFVSV